MTTTNIRQAIMRELDRRGWVVGEGAAYRLSRLSGVSQTILQRYLRDGGGMAEKSLDAVCDSLRLSMGRVRGRPAPEITISEVPDSEGE